MMVLSGASIWKDGKGVPRPWQARDAAASTNPHLDVQLSSAIHQDLRVHDLPGCCELVKTFFLRGVDLERAGKGSCEDGINQSSRIGAAVATAARVDTLPFD